MDSSRPKIIHWSGCLRQDSDWGSPDGGDSILHRHGCTRHGGINVRVAATEPRSVGLYPAHLGLHTPRPARTGRRRRALRTRQSCQKLEAINRSAEGKDVWVMGGGDLAGQFAFAGLLDELWVHFAPVTLGSGHPLFTHPLQLDLVDVVRNRNFVCAHYRACVRPRVFSRHHSKFSTYSCFNTSSALVRVSPIGFASGSWCHCSRAAK